MTFLNPIYLLALPAALVPLILHLIFRRPPRLMMFSCVAWLKQVHERAMPRQKLRELILLILRTLLVLALVFFFSRPVLEQSGFFSAKSDQSTLVFLVDLSASMGIQVGGEEGFALLRDDIQSVLRKIPKDMKLGLVGCSNRVEVELSPNSEKTKLNVALQNLKTTARPTDLEPAFKLAYQMLSHQPRGRKTIVVVSDQARHAYESLLKRGGPVENYDPEVNVLFWEALPEVPNTGVKNISLSLSGEGVLKGQWIVERDSLVRENQAWKLTLNGRVVAQGVLGSDVKSDDAIALQALLPEGGFYKGRLELASDALAFDDTFYVAGRVPKGFRILFVDGESGLAPADSEVYFLRLACETPRDPRLQVLTVIRPEGLARQDFDQFEGMVLANVGDVEEDVLMRLRSWVEKGRGLLLTAGSKWPSQGGSHLGLIQIKPSVKGEWKFEKPTAPPAFLSSLAGLNEFEWDQVTATTFVPLPAGASQWTPLLNLNNGAALLASQSVGKGMVLVWLTSLDRAWTNFPAKPLYAPFVREVVASLADPLRAQTSLNGWMGEPMRLQLSPSVRSVTVRDPGGVTSAGRVSENGVLIWTNTSSSGLYDIKPDSNDEPLSFAINLPGVNQEGSLKRIKISDLKPLFPKSSVHWVPYRDRSFEMVLAYLQGRDLTSVLLVLIFILLLAETILSWSKSLKFFAKPLIAGFLMVGMLTGSALAGEGNRFVWAQLKYEGDWDPYPNVYDAILDMMRKMTNIDPSPQRKIVTLKDDALFAFPFLLVKGNSAFSLSSGEKTRLKSYIDGGGFIFFDDTLASARSAFANSVRSLFAEVYPDRPFQRLSQDHSVFRSFFLLRGVGGRRIAERYLEGLDVGGSLGGQARTAVVYCANDLLGTWLRDPMGRPTFVCEPGGETQRWESFKLTLNVIYFSLTGTYKRDAIHQPFIERKLGS